MGNIEFRNIVNTRKEEYLAVHTRDHINKNRIATEVVAAVRAGGGRFLKRAPTAEGDPIPGEPEKWILADEKAVVEKAKQALRQVPSSERRRLKEEKMKQQKEEEEAMKLGADTLASIGSQRPQPQANDNEAQPLQSQQEPPPHYNNSTVQAPHQMYSGYTSTNYVQQQQQHPHPYNNNNNSAPAMYAQSPNSNNYGTSMPQGYTRPVPVYPHHPYAAYNNLPVNSPSDMYGRMNGGTTNVHDGMGNGLQGINVAANGRQPPNNPVYAFDNLSREPSNGPRSQSSTTSSPRVHYDSSLSVAEQQQAIYDQIIYAQKAQSSPNNMQEGNQRPRFVNQSSQGMLDTTAAASAPSNAADFESLRKQLVQQATMVLSQKAQSSPNNMQEDNQSPRFVNQSSQGMLDTTAAASAPSNAVDFESLREQLVQQATMEAILEQKQLNNKLKEQLRQGLDTATAASDESSGFLRYQQEIRKRELELQMQQGIEVAARAASMILESEQALLRGQSSDNQSLATIDMSGRSGGGASVLSASEIQRLQELFDGATAGSAQLRQQQQQRNNSGIGVASTPPSFVPVAASKTSGSRSSTKPRRSGAQSVKSKDSLISGLEDMSLPSMSIGEISDFTEPPTRIPPVNNNIRRGDSIAEGSEHSSVYSEAFKEEAERARTYMERLSSKSSKSSSDNMEPHDPADDPSSNDDESESRLQAVAALTRMGASSSLKSKDMDIDEDPPEAQTSSPPQQPPSTTAISRKKQRKSLSSYYREMKANQSGRAPSPTTDSMAIDG